MTRTSFSAALFCTLPFFIEGVRGQQHRDLEARQIFTPTADGFPASPSPFVIVNDPTLLTACTPTNITWVYAGVVVPFSLSATDFGVSQDASPPPSAVAGPTPTFSDGNNHLLAVPTGATEVGTTTSTIIQNADPHQSIVPWVVNVPPQRWYRIEATGQGQILANSHPFYVQSGLSLACLSDSSSSSPPPTPLPMSTLSLSTPASSPSPSPSPTLGGVAVPDPSSSTSPSPSSSSSGFDTGAIIGVVVGALALIAIVLMVYLCLRRRRNALDKPIAGHFGGAKLVRGWGGLGSVDSNIHRASRAVAPGGLTATDAAPNVKHHSASESFGHAFSEMDRSANASPLSSTEEKFSTSPASYGRDPFDDAGGMVLATLPPHSSRSNSVRSSLQYAPLSLPQQGRERTPSFTFDSLSFPVGASGSSTPGMPAEIPSGSGRRPSADSISYPPTSPPSAYQYYPSAVLTATGLGRSHSTSSSTGGAPPSNHSSQRQKADSYSASTPSVTSKKTPRKPVPVYDPSHPSTISTSTVTPGGTPPSPHILSSSPIATTPISPATAPLASLSGQAHYAKKPGPGTSTGTNELAHKSSFGPGGIEGKQLHYLIPDMPLAKND